MTIIKYRSFITDAQREELVGLGRTQFEMPKPTKEWAVDRKNRFYNTSSSWVNGYHINHDIELDELSASNLEVYHELVARLLKDGRWIAIKGKTKPDFTGENGRYSLGLVRYFYKNGEVYEMSIQLPISYVRKEIDSIAVYSSYGDGTIGEFLPIADAAENMDAFISNIGMLYEKAAAVDYVVCEVKVMNMATDYDLLKEKFLLKEGVIKQRPCLTLGADDNSDFASDFGFTDYKEKGSPFSEYKNLRLIGFNTPSIMQIGFTSGDDDYVYDVPFNDYQKALAAKWTAVNQA